jgi:hypothetical protein
MELRDLWNDHCHDCTEEGKMDEPYVVVLADDRQ